MNDTVEVAEINLTQEELEILMLENALRNAREHVCRAKNRVLAAQDDLEYASQKALTLAYKLDMARTRYLRAVV